MSRPTTKKDLIEAANTNFNQLWELIDSLSEKEISTPFDFSNNPKIKEAHWSRDKNLRDILIHIYEWHQLLINWISKNRAGDNIKFLPEPYNWKTYGEMNIKFWENHQNTSYEQSVELIKNSHSKVIEIIKDLYEEQLFTKKYFPWTGTTNVATYSISATCSHYDWAVKKIKKHTRNIAI